MGCHASNASVSSIHVTDKNQEKEVGSLKKQHFEESVKNQAKFVKVYGSKRSKSEIPKD